MERKNYIVAVDLGSSQVVVAVGDKQPDGLVEVLSVVSEPVEGVKAGRIDNIELVGKAIGKAISRSEEQLGIRITDVYAGISGEFVRCARHTDHVFVYDPQNGVSQRDVEGLFDRMRNVQAPDEEIIMERVPQSYIVDDEQQVKNPVGSFGRKLSSTFNFILCQKTPIQRLELALKRQSIKLLNVIPDTLASAEAVLAADEKEEGVAVVDLGAGVTDVTVYHGNVVRYIVSIPMGASAINRDIHTLSVQEKFVESLKQRYGSAVADLAPEDKLIRVSGRTARESKDILLRNLATVIEARATDIVEYVRQEINDSGYGDRLGYGIVLTGGSAKLKDLDKLFTRETGMEVRVAVPEMGVTESSLERIADPAYATAVGLLLKGAAMGTCSVVERPAAPATPHGVQSVAATTGLSSRTDRPARPVAGIATPLTQRTTTPASTPEQPKPAVEPSRITPQRPAPHSISDATHMSSQPHHEAPEEERPEDIAAQSEFDDEEIQEQPKKRGLVGLLQSALDQVSRGFMAEDDNEI